MLTQYASGRNIRRLRVRRRARMLWGFVESLDGLFCKGLSGLEGVELWGSIGLVVQGSEIWSRIGWGRGFQSQGSQASLEAELMETSYTYENIDEAIEDTLSGFTRSRTNGNRREPRKLCRQRR